MSFFCLNLIMIYMNQPRHTHKPNPQAYIHRPTDTYTSSCIDSVSDDMVTYRRRNPNLPHRRRYPSLPHRRRYPYLPAFPRRLPRTSQGVNRTSKRLSAKQPNKRVNAQQVHPLPQARTFTIEHHCPGG